MRQPKIYKYLFLPLLVIPAYIYLLIVHLRNLFYDFNLLRSKKIGVPVISVGNISAGGSGKSPFTVWLASSMQKLGYKPAILSRGYGRKSKGLVVVSNGEKVLADSLLGGDEPVMMAEKLPGIPVIADADRIRGAEYIVREFDVNVIILDDAFQHRRIHRDLDIILWNSKQSGTDLLPLPAGHQRDEKKRLKKCDLLFLTKADENSAEKWRDLEKFHKIDAVLSYKNENPRHVASGEELKDRSDYSMVAVAGIAFPHDFFAWLKKTYPKINWIFIPLPDHVGYSPEFFADLKKKYPRCRGVVTTEKDRVKMRNFEPDDLYVSPLAVYPLHSTDLNKIILKKL